MSQVETASHPPEVPPQPRRWRRWLGILFGLFLLWLLAGYGYFVLVTDRDLAEAMAEADRESTGGWQLEDVEARREQVPDAENAALIVLKVKKLLPEPWPADPEDAANSVQPWIEQFRNLPPEVQLPAAQLRWVRANLAQVEPARAEARKLIGMTRGRFPLVWGESPWETKLHSPAARDAAVLLRFEAALASQDGAADNAVALVRGLFGAARSVGDEPTLISSLIRLACDAQAVAALERALAQGEPSLRELEAVQALLEKEAVDAGAPMFTQAMRGERAGMHKTLLNLRDRADSLATITGSKGGVETTVTNIVGPTLARRSHGTMLKLLNEYVAATQLPFDHQPAAMERLDRRVKQAKMDYDVVTALLMPAIMKVGEAHRRGVGNLRCAFVAVALERYRRDHGRWPDTLDALVPKYLSAVPTDPQDGRPLRYKRRPDGVVVYWLGPDGTDDGGKLDRENPQRKGVDLGFELWDVGQRRRPAPEAKPDDGNRDAAAPVNPPPPPAAGPKR
jgi:hypothetical protein